MVRVKHLWGFFYYQKEKKSFLGYLSLKVEPPMNNAIISRQLHSSQTRLGEDLLETFVKELLSCGFGTGKALFLQHPRDTLGSSVPQDCVDHSSFSAYLPSHVEACNLIKGGSSRPGLFKKECLPPPPGAAVASELICFT